MIIYIVYWAGVLTLAWLSETSSSRTAASPNNIFFYNWVEWRVCHNQEFWSYLLSYLLLFPQALIIGYNVIAMYRNTLTLFLASNSSFLFNYVFAIVLANLFESGRPLSVIWCGPNEQHVCSVVPAQVCDPTLAVPDAAMVASLSFTFQLFIMKQTLGLGLSEGFILTVILLAVGYVAASLINHYLYLWQALINVGIALALAAVWTVAAELFISELGGFLTFDQDSSAPRLVRFIVRFENDSFSFLHKKENAPFMNA